MERRLRTKWQVRRWYKRTARIASVVGASVAILLVALLTAKAGAAETLGSPRGLVMSAAMIGAGAIIPYQIVRAIWRHQRDRNWEEWD